jgi:predicted nucleic acid-binding protein
VIVLDTNVVSMLMERKVDARALAWLDRQLPDTLWTTSITVMEVRFGLELKPAGRRRGELEAAFVRVLNEDFEGRILSLDKAAAEFAGDISARHRLAGHPIEIRDAQIAGIAMACGARLATRNIRHFGNTGIELINPWE